MATFYLVPARLQLGRQFGDLLSQLFPGLDYPRSMWHDLAEALGAAAQCHDDVYVVYAEDLPEGMPLDLALEEYFGMEPGDEVIVVRPGEGLREVDAHQWVHEARRAA
jgi:hypothetical protein